MIAEISFALCILFSHHVSYKLPMVFEYAELLKNRIEINGGTKCYLFQDMKSVINVNCICIL